MPSDHPNRDDQELARVLSDLGVERSARTCLRWRRMGVLLPPNPDPDALPRFSDEAIQRALLWAELIERFRTGVNAGYDSTILALWANPGVDLPASVVVPALRSWCESKAKLFTRDRILLDQKTTAARHERHMHSKLPPDFANQITGHAHQIAAGQIEEASGVGQIRAELTARTAAHLSGEDEGDEVTYAIGEALGFEGETLDIVSDLGGVASVPEMLAVVDMCAEDDTHFDRLVEIKLAMMDGFSRVSTHPEEFSPIGIVFDMLRRLDPGTLGMVIAVCALTGLTVEGRDFAEQAPLRFEEEMQE